MSQRKRMGTWDDLRGEVRMIQGKRVGWFREEVMIQGKRLG